MIVNRLRRRLDAGEWDITIVDHDDVHPYQPGFLFLPFGILSNKQITHSRHSYLPDGVNFVIGDVDRVDAATNAVTLTDGPTLGYDYLVIASGTTPRPDQTPGMLGSEWHRSIFEFYTFEGAKALTKALEQFDHGRLVVHITDMPIKCPVAPLEFTFLADAWLRKRGLRDQVEMVYVTPLPGAFDGHANCFIETGNGEGLLIDFNYDTEPLTGKFPLPVVGPMDLLKETRANHLGKLAFRWIYWNVLLRGRPIPISTHMSMVGKNPASANPTKPNATPAK